MPNKLKKVGVVYPGGVFCSFVSLVTFGRSQPVLWPWQCQAGEVMLATGQSADSSHGNSDMTSLKVEPKGYFAVHQER